MLKDVDIKNGEKLSSQNDVVRGYSGTEMGGNKNVLRMLKENNVSIY